jgi:hypothetical protein
MNPPKSFFPHKGSEGAGVGVLPSDNLSQFFDAIFSEENSEKLPENRLLPEKTSQGLLPEVAEHTHTEIEEILNNKNLFQHIKETLQENGFEKDSSFFHFLKKNQLHIQGIEKRVEGNLSSLGENFLTLFLKKLESFYSYRESLPSREELEIDIAEAMKGVFQDLKFPQNESGEFTKVPVFHTAKEKVAPFSFCISEKKGSIKIPFSPEDFAKKITDVLLSFKKLSLQNLEKIQKNKELKNLFLQLHFQSPEIQKIFSVIAKNLENKSIKNTLDDDTVKFLKAFSLSGLFNFLASILNYSALRQWTLSPELYEKMGESQMGIFTEIPKLWMNGLSHTAEAFKNGNHHEAFLLFVPYLVSFIVPSLACMATMYERKKTMSELALGSENILSEETEKASIQKSLKRITRKTMVISGAVILPMLIDYSSLIDQAGKQDHEMNNLVKTLELFIDINEHGKINNSSDIASKPKRVDDFFDIQIPLLEKYLLLAISEASFPLVQNEVSGKAYSGTASGFGPMSARKFNLWQSLAYGVNTEVKEQRNMFTTSSDIPSNIWGTSEYKQTVSEKNVEKTQQSIKKYVQGFYDGLKQKTSEKQLKNIGITQQSLQKLFEKHIPKFDMSQIFLEEKDSDSVLQTVLRFEDSLQDFKKEFSEFTESSIAVIQSSLEKNEVRESTLGAVKALAVGRKDTPIPLSDIREFEQKNTEFINQIQEKMDGLKTTLVHQLEQNLAPVIEQELATLKRVDWQKRQDISESSFLSEEQKQERLEALAKDFQEREQNILQITPNIIKQFSSALTIDIKSPNFERKGYNPLEYFKELYKEVKNLGSFTKLFMLLFSLLISIVINYADLHLIIRSLKKKMNKEFDVYDIRKSRNNVKEISRQVQKMSSEILSVKERAGNYPSFQKVLSQKEQTKIFDYEKSIFLEHSKKNQLSEKEICFIDEFQNESLKDTEKNLIEGIPVYKLSPKRSVVLPLGVSHRYILLRNKKTQEVFLSYDQKNNNEKNFDSLENDYDICVCHNSYVHEQKASQFLFPLNKEGTVVFFSQGLGMYNSEVQNFETEYVYFT